MIPAEKYIGTMRMNASTPLPFSLFLESGYAAQVHTIIPRRVNTKVIITENTIE